MGGGGFLTPPPDPRPGGGLAHPQQACTALQLMVAYDEPSYEEKPVVTQPSWFMAAVAKVWGQRS